MTQSMTGRPATCSGAAYSGVRSLTSVRVSTPGESASVGASTNDVPLLHKRVRLKSGWNEFTFLVDRKPMRAEIDRDHLFIDRVMEDNGKAVDVR